MKTLALLLLFNVIDGYQLLERSRASKSGRAYAKYIAGVRDAALQRAWEAAGTGETQVYFCFEMTDLTPRGVRGWDEVRHDIEGLFMRISGVTFKADDSSKACFYLDWAANW